MRYGHSTWRLHVRAANYALKQESVKLPCFGEDLVSVDVEEGFVTASIHEPLGGASRILIAACAASSGCRAPTGRSSTALGFESPGVPSANQCESFQEYWLRREIPLGMSPLHRLPVPSQLQATPRCRGSFSFRLPSNPRKDQVKKMLDVSNAQVVRQCLESVCRCLS